MSTNDVALRADGRVSGYAICPECDCRLEMLILPDGSCRYVSADVPAILAQAARAEQAAERMRLEMAGLGLYCQALADEALS